MNISGPGGDEWDDSELIKAYDKAVKNWRKSKSSDDGTVDNIDSPVIGPWQSIKKEEPKHLALIVGSWVMGSPCRAVWTDGLEYEAKIVGIEGLGCTIRFVGYGNQEKKELSELKETFGKRSRDRQRREAQQVNSEHLTTGGPPDGEDYFSSVSLTSSMCNNCPSIVNGRDETTTDISGSASQRESVSSSSAIRSPRKKTSPAGKRKRNDEVDNMSVDPDDTPVLDADGRTEDVLPSGAEATMGSSSSTSDISDGDDNIDGDDEATSAPGPFREAFKGFPSMVPQFPVPPMPMSLAGADGKFDFRRGQLPSLLLSWYMSGYHAGYFDATQEKKTQQKEDSKPRNKRQ